ncbi:hypothetical protein [Levilactobacillus spicheri]|uniref:Uncharacterized protein n=2 Tax=Levilactobacillus spicheri TaxID=216463 RepID=A0ABQ0WQC7_9LACO|nr:hypothetical protein [Levilactobacillus spicheri]GEO67293.1 hypothetical protein LSP04_17120 [Levilactobacillus spicheri]
MLISAEVPNPIPAGYAVYQLDAVQYGADSFAGWKMVKQKTVPAVDDKGQPIKGPDGKPQMLCVDDPDAEVTYDPHTQVLKQVDQQGEQIESLQTENKSLKSANELTQQGLMEAVDYLSSKLTPASTTTDTGSAATSTAAPASSAASES